MGGSHLSVPLLLTGRNLPGLGLLPQALTLGSRHRLGEEQGPTSVTTAQGSSLKAGGQNQPSGEEGRIPPGPYISLSSPHG